MKQGKENTILKTLQIIIFAGLILYYSASVLIPLAYAMFISFILFPIVKWLENKGIHKALAISLSLSLLIIFVGGIVTLLISQAKGFAGRWQTLQPMINSTIVQLGNYLHTSMGIPTAQIDKWTEAVMDKAGAQLFSAVGNTMYFSAVSAVNLFIIPVYAVLVLYNRKQLIAFLFSLFPVDRRNEITSVLHEVVYTFHHFIKGMVTVYLIVGILNSTGLYFLGIPNPILFGFIASILTFIPYIGIIIGSLLPITITWTMHDGNILYPIGVVAVFAFVQVLEANIIFPLAVSHRLKISTLFTMIAIFTGGVLWGLSGMILFIPALGILKLILDRMPAYGNVANLLGD